MSIEAPDYIGYVTGYRTWEVVHRPGPEGDESATRLRSIGDTVWAPFEAMEAKHVWGYLATESGDVLRCSGAPCNNSVFGYGSGCGFYANRTEEQNVRRITSYVNPHHSGPYQVSPYVAGTVAMWGRVWRHAKGYRAQFATPLSITGAWGVDPRVIAANYNIPFEESAAWKSVSLRIDQLRMNRSKPPSPRPWDSQFLTYLPTQQIIPRLTVHQGWRNQRPNLPSPPTPSPIITPQLVIPGAQPAQSLAAPQSLQLQYMTFDEVIDEVIEEALFGAAIGARPAYGKTYFDMAMKRYAEAFLFPLPVPAPRRSKRKPQRFIRLFGFRLPVP